jgi:hypothetical protein
VDEEWIPKARRPEQPPRQDDDRRPLIIVALLIVFGALAGFLLVRTLTKEAPKLVKVAPQPPPRPVEEEEEVDEGRDRLFQPKALEDMSYEDFAAVMGFEPEPNTSPAVKAFARAVLSHPEMKDDVLKCKRANRRGKKCLGRQLLETLEKRPEFEAIASQFGAEPAFTEALLVILKDPEGKELLAVAQAVGGQIDPEIAEELKKKVPKRKMRANISTILMTLAEALKEAELKRSTATAKASGDSMGKAGAHDTVDLRGLDKATTERILKLLEVYPWLAPLGVDNLRRLEQEAPKYGLYGACFSLLLHQECWDACKSDTAKKCNATDEVWNPWDACHDWKGQGEEADKVCISRCLYQKPPCTVPPPVWNHYCVCRPGCCGKGGCGCCLSPYHSHNFCQPAWEGDILLDFGTVGLPPELFYPACSSHGDGPAHCDCCYDKL